MYHKLIHIKENRDGPDMSRVERPLTDDDVVGFGIHKDKKLRDVPIYYLAWMVDNQIQYPRLQRSRRWVMVMAWIRSKG
jgi:hypothetical protein